MSDDIANVELSEIEVTPAMIEAGERALCGVSLIEDDWGSIVFDVYTAMSAARLLRGKR